MLTDIILPEDLKTLDTQSLVEFLDYNLNKKRVVEKNNGEVSIEEDECVFTPAMKESFKENKIDGSTFSELSLSDLKELVCLPKEPMGKRCMINLKVIVNKMNSKVESSLLIDNLNTMYQVLNDRFLDYQNQYNKLRLDVLEIIKTTNNSPPTLQTSASKNNSSSSPSTSHHALGSSAEDESGNEYYSSEQPPLAQKSSTYSLGKAFTNVNPNQPDSTITNEQVSEPLKQLRASKEDSCEKVLKNAMKKHNLQDQDWRSYVLVICYGDQERILSNDERPVSIFKQLKKQGLHPAIMLRQKDDIQLDSNTPGGRL